MSAWVNSAHPKISLFLNAAKKAERNGADVKKCKQFLYFLHKEHLGYSNNEPEYISFIQQHQSPALDELFRAKVITSEEAKRLLLTNEDFVPWEGERG